MRFFDSVERFWPDSMLDEACAEAIESSENFVKKWEENFSLSVGGRRSFFLDQGRNAFTLALRAAGLEGMEVIMPAFICPAVAEAVFEAGAIPVAVDVTLPNGELDFEKATRAITPRTGAVIAAHLFGQPIDPARWKELLDSSSARSRKILLIEDCAHTLLAEAKKGAPVGTAGDIAVFSFNYDKPLALMGGGMLVVRDETLADRISEKMMRSLPSPRTEALEIKSWCAWMSSRMKAPARPPLGAMHDESKSAAAYSIGEKLPRYPRVGPKVGTVRASLAIKAMSDYTATRDIRNANAEYLRPLMEALGFALPSAKQGVLPSLLRLNLFAPDDPRLDVSRVALRLCASGFRSGRFNWPATIVDDPATKRFVRAADEPSNARKLAARSINLPINHTMTRDDLDEMAEIVASEIRGKGGER